MKYLLIGYYGHNNLGDEALLRILVYHIKNRDPDSEFFVVSSNTDNSQKANPDLRSNLIEGISKKEPIKSLKLIYSIDELIFPGGHIISKGSIKRIFIYCLIGYLFGKRITFFPCGASEINSFLGKKMLKFIQKHSIFAVRDRKSARHVFRATTIFPKILPDIGFLLQGKGLITNYPANSRNKKNTVGINIRNYGISERIEYYRFIDIAKLLSKLGYKILLFTTSSDKHQDDVVIAKRLSKMLFARTIKHDVFIPESVVEFLNLYKELEFTVVTRLHAAIFPIVNKVPCLAICYDTFWKMESVFVYMGFEDLLLKSPDLDRPKILCLITNFEKIKSRVNLRGKELKKILLKEYSSFCGSPNQWSLHNEI